MFVTIGTGNENTNKQQATKSKKHQQQRGILITNSVEVTMYHQTQNHTTRVSLYDQIHHEKCAK